MRRSKRQGCRSISADGNGSGDGAMDCPTCRYHPRPLVGTLCQHPLGELYRRAFDALHVIAPCHGWRPTREEQH